MGLSWGAVVVGLLNGLTIGLLGVGLVLVYRANRFVNLAHAQLGTLSALLLQKWVVDWGWSWPVAFVAAVAIGVGVGVLTDRVFVRPLRRRTSSQVSLLILTIGISQLLLALTYIPALGPDRTKATAFYPQPFQSHVRIGGVTLLGSSLLTFVLVPALALALAAFLRYTIVGKQIRAAASNPEAARLCGVRVATVGMITWAIAGGLSAVSAVLQAPTQPTFNIAALGPRLLMLTLGAAAVGAFTSLPVTLAGGIGLGVAAQLVVAHTGNAGDGTIAVFVLILAVVLVRGRAIGETFGHAGAAVDDRRPTVIPPALRTDPVVQLRAVWLTAVALFLAVLLPLFPTFRSEGHRFLLVLVLLYALIGVSLTMILGWAGQVSLAHVAVVGCGAYMTARLGDHGWSLPAICLTAGLVGAVVMIVIGLPALRVRGLSLIVTSLGFAVIAPEWLYRQRWFGSEQPFGRPVEIPRLASGIGAPRTQLHIYYVALAVLVLVVVLVRSLQRSTPGRVMIAVRDNERASASFGFTPATVKLAFLAVSGFVAAGTGALWAIAWRVVSPAQFGPELSIAVLAVPVIGGIGSVVGAVAGALAVYMPAFFLGPALKGLFGDVGHSLGFQLMIAGAGLVITVLSYPTGLAGAAQSAWERWLEHRAANASAPSDATPVALVTEGVRVRFGGVVALDEPVLRVSEGEIVGLIGPNGAGKTTLLNVVSGVIRPERGSVRLFGREVVELPPDVRAALGMARTFQDASLFRGLTVTETIGLALARTRRVGTLSALVGAPWARWTSRQLEREAQAIVERFGLTPWASTLTAELSTGTRRICDLAAQFAASPKLLVLDEPTAGVAQREAEAFGPLLRRIRDDLGCAVLIVEHDMPLLMSTCDRVVAMDAGRVIADGAPETIRENPDVIASYLGTDSVAVNRSGHRPTQVRKPRAAALRAARSPA